MNKTFTQLQRCLLLCSCLALPAQRSGAQDVRAYVASAYYHTGTETADQLLQQLRAHLFTQLSLQTPHGLQTFKLRSSKTLVAGDRGSAFYEGAAADDPQQELMVFVHNGSVMMRLRNRASGEGLLLANREMAAAAGITPQTAGNVYQPVGGYVWVQDPDAVAQEYNTNALPAAVPETDNAASSGNLAKTTTASDAITYLNTYKSLGQIGKRDISIHVHNYNNSVPAFDYTRAAFNLADILTAQQTNKANIRVLVYLPSTGWPLTATALPFNSDAGTFLNAFRDYITANASTLCAAYGTEYKSHAYPLGANEFHILLQKGFTWSGSKGTGYAGGQFGVAAFAGTVTAPDPNPSRVLGANVNALPTGSCFTNVAGSLVKDVMYSGTATCPQDYVHTPANRALIDSRITAASVMNEIPLKATADLSSSKYPFPIIYSVPVDTRDVLLKFSPTASSPMRVQGALFDGQVNAYDDMSGTVPTMSTYGDRIAVFKVKFPDYGHYTIRTLAASTTDPHDTYLYLLDADGNMVASDDDSGGDYLSQIGGYFNPQYYYVIVGGYLNQGINGWLRILWDMGPLARAEADGMDMGNGNIIYSADFGMANKHAAQDHQHPALAADQLMRIYPNPVAAGKSITVYTGTTSHKDYALYTIMGQRVLNGSTEAAAATVSLQGLATGDYLLRLTDTESGKSSTQHVVVE